MPHHPATMPLRAATTVVVSGLLAFLPPVEALAVGGPGDRSGAPVIETGGEALPREVVVRFRAGTPAAAHRAARDQVGAVAVERPGIPGLEVLRLGAGRPVGSAIATLVGRRDVLYAEPNLVVRTSSDWALPNDPHFEQQWGLRNTGQSGGTLGADIDVLASWAGVTREEPDPVAVAVADTGVEATHPDLQGVVLEEGRSWTKGGGGGATKHLSDPHGHGTHVAGIVAAVQDNEIGIAGVSGDAVLMSLQVLDQKGSGKASDVAAAFHHAGDLGIPVVNASLGWTGWFQAAHDAIAEHPGTLFVVAAGNEGADNDGPAALYPCAFRLPNVLCVTASDRNDGRPSFANVGSTTVHLGAPGSEIISTVPPAGYKSMNGTSMATPHAAGVAAMVLAERPGATTSQVKEALLRSVDPLLSMEPTATLGRLNAATAIIAADRLVDEGVATTGAFLSAAVDVRPRRAFQPARTFEVPWSGDGERHDVRVRTAAGGSAFGTPQAFVLDDPGGRSSFRGRLGSTYCFQGRTRDGDGVTSPWSEERCTAVPVNDRALSADGPWVRRTGRAGYFQRSFSQSARRGSSLLLRVRGARQVALVATRCPRCGTVEVRWRGERVRRLALRAPSVRKMRFIQVPVLGNGDLEVRVISSGRPVRIEAIGVSRA